MGSTDMFIWLCDFLCGSVDLKVNYLRTAGLWCSVCRFKLGSPTPNHYPSFAVAVVNVLLLAKAQSVNRYSLQQTQKSISLVLF